MRLPAIITTDLHFTANPADEYRWGLFSWLKQQAKAYGAKSVAILGDITDAKDYHPAVLVNRLVTEITDLAKEVGQVTILTGNHDYLKDGHPFFEFLNAVPGVRFVSSIYSDTDEDVQVLWLPHSKNPVEDWAGLRDLSWYSHIFMHQTMTGSVASNGQEMSGEGVEKLEWFRPGKDLPLIWSGDIHVPQKIGLVEYIGSPYPVHFGDSFDARCVLLRPDLSRKNLYFTTIRRQSVTVHGGSGVYELEMDRGDQVKVKVVLSQSEQHDWGDHRRLVESWAEKHGVELHGLKLEVTKSRRRLADMDRVRAADPETVLLEFVKAEGLPADVYQAGVEVMS